MINQGIFEKALANTISYILENPLIYFSESDIHSIVYTRLGQEIPSIINPIETSLTIGLNLKDKPSVKKYKTICIHREYGLNGFDYARSDIVIFDNKDVVKITDPINLKIGKTKNDYIKPQFVLEFGTEKSAGSASNFEEHLHSDIEKASSSKNYGYIIHIQRVYNRDNDLTKYKEFEIILNKYIISKNQNVKLLFFLVSIGSNSVKIFREGKVKMYKKENKSIIGINMNEYIENIMSELLSQEKIF